MFLMVHYLKFPITVKLDAWWKKQTVYIAENICNWIIYRDVAQFFTPSFSTPFFPFRNLLWRQKKTISLKDARDVMKRICFQTKIADALTTLLSRYSNWTKPTTAATTHSNKMIVLSQLIVHGIQWAYDQAVRAVKIHSKDFNNFFLQNLKFAVVE